MRKELIDNIINEADGMKYCDFCRLLSVIYWNWGVSLIITEMAFVPSFFYCFIFTNTFNISTTSAKSHTFGCFVICF